MQFFSCSEFYNKKATFFPKKLNAQICLFDATKKKRRSTTIAIFGRNSSSLKVYINKNLYLPLKFILVEKKKLDQELCISITRDLFQFFEKLNN